MSILLPGNVKQINMGQEIYIREKYYNQANTWKLLITLFIFRWKMPMKLIEVGAITIDISML